MTCENYETPSGVLLSRLDHNGTTQPCVLGRTISMTIQRQICLKQKSDRSRSISWEVMELGLISMSVEQQHLVS